ncbi:MAG: Outer membrane protein assembly factor BamA [candidate division TM6 bacterium GW2011_GWF2_38_10]|nr:MAG: Outer membrane protein assembly factor BamA [candidate division TM6 bacterium GW2011_GWF2_38_10]
MNRRKINIRAVKCLSYRTLLITWLSFSGSVGLLTSSSIEEKTLEQVQEDKRFLERFTIKDIQVQGAEYVKKDVILKRLAYKVGDLFDIDRRVQSIKNIYGLGYFSQVEIEAEIVGDTQLILYVLVEEKKLLEGVTFEGNTHIKSSKFKETLNIDKITAVDEDTVRSLSSEIMKMYKEENRHKVVINGVIVPNKENPKKASVVFTINEGPRSVLSRVYFKGNKEIQERKLRNALYSKEDWLLSFMDNAGNFQQDMVDVDKHRIEYLYRDQGFLNAKVYKTDVVFLRDNKDVAVTFYINEGPQFLIRSVQAPGDEVFTQDEVEKLIKIAPGDVFSQSKTMQTVNQLKDLWGQKGYIYADVFPQVKPDEATNEVDITFHVERGKLLYVNRINITGNSITRDKVIRRQLRIVEGDLVTSGKLNESQSNVEYLSFFEREGVNWKVHRITDDLADLEMNVKEAKTGNLNFMLSYGSDQHAQRPSLKGSITVEKNNLFGLGYDVGGMLQANRHRIQRLEGHIFDPSIFDTSVSGGFYGYKRWDEYESWRRLNKTPIQQILGANIRLGFGLPKIDQYTNLVIEFGIEDIWNNKPQAYAQDELVFGPIVRRTFQEGSVKWLMAELVRDKRNHKIYPNKGSKVSLSTKFAPDGFNHKFSFLKTELEASQYTALIGEDTLVLALHAKAGRVTHIGKDSIVPYKELFHMGGQSTVRGFTWGGVGPAWRPTGDPLGGRNAVLFNTELIFPLIPDYSMKAHCFYDAGAGWDTPKADLTAQQKSLLMRDKFNLRHSVGFGLNILKPMPAKIDWGFKLDRNRKAGETAHEFHLNMNYAF